MHIWSKTSRGLIYFIVCLALGIGATLVALAREVASPRADDPFPAADTPAATPARNTPSATGVDPADGDNRPPIAVVVEVSPGAAPSSAAPASTPTQAPTDSGKPAAPSLPSAPLFGYENGIYLRTSDGSYSLVANGLAQSAGINALKWWLQYTVSPHFNIQVGRLFLPYSRQFHMNPRHWLLADISVADYAFNLPGSIGAKIGGTVKRLTYDIFLVNSIRSLGVTTQINRGDSIARGGRLALAILDPYPRYESMPKAPKRAQLSIGAAVVYNPIADGSAAQDLHSGDDTVNLTADLGFRWQRLTVQGAFYYRSVTNHAVADSYGFYGQAGIYRIKERLELVGRASGALLTDRTMVPGLKNPAAGSTRESSGGFNVYLFGHGAKLQTDYSHLAYDPFAAIPYAAHRWRMQAQVQF